MFSAFGPHGNRPALGRVLTDDLLGGSGASFESYGAFQHARAERYPHHSRTQAGHIRGKNGGGAVGLRLISLRLRLHEAVGAVSRSQRSGANCLGSEVTRVSGLEWRAFGCPVQLVFPRLRCGAPSQLQTTLPVPHQCH